MSFLAQLWREVGRHVEMQEAVRRIAPMLASHLPIDQVVVRRIDREPLRLTTLTAAAAHSAETIDTQPTRSQCDAAGEQALNRFMTAGRAQLLTQPEAAALARALVPQGLRGSIIALPLGTPAQPLAVALLVANASGALVAEHLNTAQELVEPFSVAFENDQRLHELARMREALEADRRALLSRLERQDISDTVVGEAAGLSAVMERVEQVAPTDAPVLILGETGSGKEVIARAIHARSARAGGPVVRVNCGAIPSQLIDSELFGHERGSFTGAVNTRKGWFERADGGTLFLDEIGELPLEAQVRLLRVLQDGSLERVGGHQAITVDVRIVAATHRNLETMVAEGRFREDLWYRISIFPIRLPPLRERPQDLPALVRHFAHRAGLRLGGTALAPSERDLQLLASYAWPGNVRELIAVIERAAILGNGRQLEVAKALGASNIEPGVVPPTLPPRASPLPAAPAQAAVPAQPTTGGAAPSEVAPLDSAMVSHIERALSATHGRIEGPFGAARMLGVNPHTLRARMRKLGIEWSRFRESAKDGLQQH